jgi:hypothetical protein
MKLVMIMISIILLLIFIMKNKKLEKWSMSNRKHPIDIVYTWVDGNDPDFLKEKSEWMNIIGKPNSSNVPSRFDDHDELKYSLRSVDKYMPYFRNIYIVVKDGQVPPYLNVNHPQLKIVPHSSIIPDHGLPTFNSLVIESCIHKIPGLSEFYLYFNDDMIVLKKLSRDFFYNKYGVPYVNYNQNINCERIPDYDIISSGGVPSYEILNLVCWNRKVINDNWEINDPGMQEHVAASCRKSWDEEIENKVKKIKIGTSNLWDNTISSKFREVDNIALNSVFRPVYYKNIKGGVKKSYHNKFVDLDKETDSKKIKDILTNFFFKNPDTTFMCVNSLPEMNKESNSRVFKDVMDKRFPKKSRFER